MGSADDLTSVVWRHDDWLRCVPLTTQTVLEYFELSPFYDHSSVNETLRKWHEPITEENLRKRGPGLEFVLQDAQEPHLFVIRRQQRRPHDIDKVDTHGAYYVLDGNIYQAPTLHATISSRADRSLYNIKVAFSKMQQDLDPLHQDVEDTAAEALQKQADIFRQKPLSAEEQDHVKRIDRIILTSLKKHDEKRQRQAGAPVQRPGSALQPPGTPGSMQSLEGSQATVGGGQPAAVLTPVQR